MMNAPPIPEIEAVVTDRFKQYRDDGYSIAVAAQRALTGHSGVRKLGNTVPFEGVTPEFVTHLSMGTLRLDGTTLVEVSD